MYWRRDYLRILFVVLLHIIGFSQKRVDKDSKKSEKIGCKNERNEDVDWYIIYKLTKIKEKRKKISDVSGGVDCAYILAPGCKEWTLSQKSMENGYIIYKLPKIKEKRKKISDVSGGVDYAYILAPGCKEWTLSEKSMENGSMIEKTLDTYYKDEKDLTYLFYNDDIPGKKSKTAAGHLKGVVVFDGETGFWLIHSMPNFPDHEKYDYPKAATSNGQTALCITFKTKELNEIANQLLYSNPNIYAKAITDEVEEQLDDKASTLWSKKPEFIKKKPFRREADLTSLEGMKFISFAKDNQLKEDLYSDIIAPTLETSLIVQTWRKGAGKFLSSTCSHKLTKTESEQTVEDVLSINMTFDKGKENKKVSFKYTQDHIKWAISSDNKNYVCIADLNRMTSQEKRGGGAVCFKSPDVADAFDSIIAKTSKSEKKGKRKKKKRKKNKKKKKSK